MPASCSDSASASASDAWNVSPPDSVRTARRSPASWWSTTKNSPFSWTRSYCPPDSSRRIRDAPSTSRSSASASSQRSKLLARRWPASALATWPSRSCAARLSRSPCACGAPLLDPPVRRLGPLHRHGRRPRVVVAGAGSPASANSGVEPAPRTAATAASASAAPAASAARAPTRRLATSVAAQPASADHAPARSSRSTRPAGEPGDRVAGRVELAPRGPVSRCSAAAARGAWPVRACSRADCARPRRPRRSDLLQRRPSVVQLAAQRRGAGRRRRAACPVRTAGRRAARAGRGPGRGRVPVARAAFSRSATCPAAFASAASAACRRPSRPPARPTVAGTAGTAVTGCSHTGHGSPACRCARSAPARSARLRVLVGLAGRLQLGRRAAAAAARASSSAAAAAACSVVGRRESLARAPRPRRRPRRARRARRSSSRSAAGSPAAASSPRSFSSRSSAAVTASWPSVAAVAGRRRPPSARAVTPPRRADPVEQRDLVVERGQPGRRLGRRALRLGAARGSARVDRAASASIASTRLGRAGQRLVGGVGRARPSSWSTAAQVGVGLLAPGRWPASGSVS